MVCLGMGKMRSVWKVSFVVGGRLARGVRQVFLVAVLFIGENVAEEWLKKRVRFEGKVKILYACFYLEGQLRTGECTESGQRVAGVWWDGP